MTQRRRRKRHHEPGHIEPHRPAKRRVSLWKNRELADKIQNWTAIAIVPIFLAMGIWVLSSYPSVVRGSLGHGTPGSFVVQRRDCGKSCNWYGLYTSSDGTITHHAHLNGGAKYVGEVVPVIDSGASGEVFPPGGNWDWLFAGIFLVIAFGYVSGGVAFFFLWLRWRS